jgi:hypothetical protein
VPLYCMVATMVHGMSCGAVYELHGIPPNWVLLEFTRWTWNPRLPEVL